LSLFTRSLLLMFGLLGLQPAGGKRKPVAPPTKPKTHDNAKPKPAQPSSDDELYSSGDICAPEPDRDDEQRDL
jgi:hypothetical protein